MAHWGLGSLQSHQSSAAELGQGVAEGGTHLAMAWSETPHTQTSGLRMRETFPPLFKRVNKTRHSWYHRTHLSVHMVIESRLSVRRDPCDHVNSSWGCSSYLELQEEPRRPSKYFWGERHQRDLSPFLSKEQVYIHSVTALLILLPAAQLTSLQPSPPSSRLCVTQPLRQSGPGVLFPIKYNDSKTARRTPAVTHR